MRDDPPCVLGPIHDYDIAASGPAAEIKLAGGVGERLNDTGLSRVLRGRDAIIFLPIPPFLPWKFFLMPLIVYKNTDDQLNGPSIA